jgi:tRNA A-37 threonylcarbamoyl transferase component Bud32/tetratricopeptide (TPR) repeat protein
LVSALRPRLAAALAARYAIEREIGRGGTAVVYLARDLKHHRQVALKVLRPDLAASLGAERFLREIRIAAGLTHPHILAVHDSGSADGLLYYVMPFVEGESLRDRLKREGPLQLDDALRVAREVADALAYAHSQGVVHRDIKPGNILLVGGHAVVADFGIAVAAGGEADTVTITERGLAIGTPAYMSPEQGGAGGPLDGRTDLYSLGCVLYEMLAGEPPFIGGSPHAVMARHASEPAPAVRAARPSVPLAVDAAVHRALAKLPADRFATAHQFAEALVSAELKGRPPRRIITRPLAAAVGLVALVIAAVFVRRPPNADTTSIGVLVIPATPEDGSADPRLPSRSALGLLAGAIDWLPGVHIIDGLALADSAGGAPTQQLLTGARQRGARYLLTGTVTADGGGRVATVDLYATGSGARIVRGQAPVAGTGTAAALGRAAMAASRGLAEQERMPLGARAILFDATGSAIAVGYLLEGQNRFWREQFDAAADAFRAAIDADSACALAYYRLSVAHVWRHDYAAALAALERAGLATTPAAGSRWRALLDAQRWYVLSEGDSAIAAFQTIVADDPTNADAWLGLAESLFHFATATGHPPTEARPAFERLITLDSAFAPIYDHLTDLALRRGELDQAARFLRMIPADDARRPARAAAITLRRTSGMDRTRALDSLARADRYTLSDLIALLVHDPDQLGLADTLARILGGPNRTPDDRRRAADYRLAILAGLGRWPEAVAAWQAEPADRPFDSWVVLTALAGFRADSIAAPMFAWARAAAVRGRAPDFTLPATHEYQQAFQALVYRATVRGDSSEVNWLLRRLKAAPTSSNPSDGLRETLDASLRARLALLAGDTAQASALLQRSLVRMPEWYVTFLPLAGMAPQRFLLADLAFRRRDGTEARRWLSSLTDSWAVSDVVYGPAARKLGAQLHR